MLDKDIKFPQSNNTNNTKNENFEPSLNTIIEKKSDSESESIKTNSDSDSLSVSDTESSLLNLDNNEKVENPPLDKELSDSNVEINIENNEEIKEDNNEEIKEEKKKEFLSKEKLEELENREIEKMAEDFQKINEREDKKKKQIELVLRIFKILNFNVREMKDLEDIVIQRERLLEKNNEKKILELVPELKEVYNSSYLTCLHDNSIFKQKFPAINLIRQVLKCNYLSLSPKIVSCGYEKLTGKKIVSRIFVIDKILF
jgi:hypothetical protein